MSASKIIRVSDAEPVDGQPYQTAVLQNPDGTPFGGGKSLKALAFIKGGDGAITGGTATLTDNSTIAVTVS